MRARTLGAVAMAIVAIGVIAGPAAADIRLNPAKNQFYFHANVGALWIDKQVSQYGVRIELWNADDQTPTDRVISESVPAGGCIDRGKSCKYRNRDALVNHLGVGSFRMQYATGKMWMKSFGTVEATPTSHMMIRIFVPMPGGDQEARVVLDWQLSKSGWRPIWSSAN